VRPSEGRVDSAELWCRKAELGPVSFAQNRDGCEGRVRACFFYSWCQRVQREYSRTTTVESYNQEEEP
jgi:hypothetical protein